MTPDKMIMVRETAKVIIRLAKLLPQDTGLGSGASVRRINAILEEARKIEELVNQEFSHIDEPSR